VTLAACSLQASRSSRIVSSISRNSFTSTSNALARNALSSAMAGCASWCVALICAPCAVHTIIVETANRFARDLIVQETGWRFLRDVGITLIATDSPDAFDDTPTAVMIRQILGSVAQFEKAMLVSKLRGARERKKTATGKCEGRKSLSESRPEVVALAKRLSRYPVNRRKRSLRDIAAELEAQGHVATTGRRYEATAIARMIAA
jgi:DNA invertase Pin-like site-specific DNA recombinase